MTSEELAIVDLDLTASRAITDGIEALHALKSIAGPDVPEHVRKTAVWLAHLVQDNASLVAALSAALQVAIRQRDEQLNARMAVESDWITTIAQNMNWTHETTQQVLLLMLNSDEQLMSDDLACDAIELAEVRGAFSRLDVDIESVIEPNGIE